MQVANGYELSVEEPSAVALGDVEGEDRAGLVGITGEYVSVDGAVTVVRTMADGEDEVDGDAVAVDRGPPDTVVNGAVTGVDAVVEAGEDEVEDDGEMVDEVVCDEADIVLSWTGAPPAGAAPPKSATRVMFTW